MASSLFPIDKASRC